MQRQLLSRCIPCLCNCNRYPVLKGCFRRFKHLNVLRTEPPRLSARNGLKRTRGFIFAAGYATNCCMPHPVAPYTKPALSPADLIRHLKGKGLGIPDEAAATQALRTVGYYRLLIYFRALQTAKVFNAGASFDQALDLYNFDRKLRLLCLDAIERVEVAIRAAINNKLAVQYGPHFYLERRYYRNTGAFKTFVKKAMEARYLGITHYEDTNNHPPLPPIWTVSEGLTFGTMSLFFADLVLSARKAVAKEFGLDETILVSWFRSINVLRNICAHHNRLWNHTLVVDRPLRAKLYRADLVDLDHFYARAVILLVLMNAIAPGHTWRQQLKDLIASYPGVPIAQMGFPADWRARPLWA